jgi:hypothetical protein
MSHKSPAQNLLATCLAVAACAPLPAWAVGSTCREIFSSAAPLASRAFFADWIGAPRVPQLASHLAKEAQAGLRYAGWRPAEGHRALPDWAGDSLANEPRAYENSFAKIFSELGIVNRKGFFDWTLRWRRERGLHAHVLDIFGSGEFIEDPRQADSITGMRNSPFYLFDSPAGAPRAPVQVVGDALEPATWAGLDGSMRARKIPAFDLVAMRPLKAWTGALGGDSMEQTQYALKYIIAQALARLAPEGQLYFTIMPPVEPYHAYRTLLDLVERVELETPYRLIILALPSDGRDIYALTGALLPKKHLY